MSPARGVPQSAEDAVLFLVRTGRKVQRVRIPQAHAVSKGQSPNLVDDDRPARVVSQIVTKRAGGCLERRYRAVAEIRNQQRAPEGPEILGGERQPPRRVQPAR